MNSIIAQTNYSNTKEEEAAPQKENNDKKKENVFFLNNIKNISKKYKPPPSFRKNKSSTQLQQQQMSRASSEGYIPPSPPFHKKTRRKSINLIDAISSSSSMNHSFGRKLMKTATSAELSRKRGISRAKSDSYIPPRPLGTANRATTKSRMLMTSRMKNIAASVTGSNLYNSSLRGKSFNSFINNDNDDNDEGMAKKKEEDSSFSYSSRKIRTSFQRLLSHMSSDSLLIMEDEDDEKEQ